MTTSTMSQVGSQIQPLTSKSSSAIDLNDSTPIEQQLQKKKDEAEVLAWGKRQYDRCRSQRSPVERQWYVNLAFYFGKQNVQMVTSNATTNGFQLIVPKAPPWRVRLVINHCRPTVRKQVSNLTAQEPKFFTVPSGTEDDDVASARITEAILDSYYREQHYKLLLRRLVWWGSICGSSFLKTYWDKTKKDSNGNTGSIVTDVIDPFHIYIPDLLQPDLELQPYLIHASTMSPDMVESIYKDENGVGIKVSSNVSGSTQILEDQFLNITGAAKSGQLNQVLILEFWIKPGAYSKFPKGAMLTIAGDKLVQFKEGWPYDHAEYPFAKFDDIDSGKFYSDAVLTDMLPLQRELNRTRSQIVEGKNLMAKPKLVAQRGSINANQVTSEPGQIILYTPGFPKPEPLVSPQLPAYVENEVARLNIDMELVAGQHDIARLITSRTSATALAYVQNQDSTMVAGAAESIEQLTEKTGRQIISLTKQFVTTTRIIKVVGYDEAFETLQFKSTDIKNNTEVYVETGSALPQDRAGRQAFLMDAFKLGLIPDPSDVLELMQVGGVQKIQQDMLIDQRAAQRENMQMVALGKNPPAANWNTETTIDPLADLLNLVKGGETAEDATEQPQLPGMPQQLPGMPPTPSPLGLPGQPPVEGLGLPQPEEQQPEIPELPVNEWDNHQIHIQIHDRFRKSQKFEAMDETTKKIFQQHVALHKTALQQNIQGQPQPSAPGAQPTMPGIPHPQINPADVKPPSAPTPQNVPALPGMPQPQH